MATDMIARAIAMSKASLVDGKVPASELPSYVDDVVEYASAASFPATGEHGKIYIALDTNTSYRWSGSTYIPITGQSDWNQSDNTAPDYIKNKPAIPSAQVNADWDAASGVAQILHKPTLGTAAAKGVDSAPATLSTNLVESGGVYTALAGKQDTLTTAKQAAVDSGITSAKVSQYDGYDDWTEYNVLQTASSVASKINTETSTATLKVNYAMKMAVLNAYLEFIDNIATGSWVNFATLSSITDWANICPSAYVRAYIMSSDGYTAMVYKGLSSSAVVAIQTMSGTITNGTKTSVQLTWSFA